MSAEPLSLDEVIQRYTVLQPPPNRLTLYAWREVLGLSPEDARDAHEHGVRFLQTVERFWTDEKRRHRDVNVWLLRGRQEPDPVTEEMREACRTWLSRHARTVQEEVLPAQGFSRIYSLWEPGNPRGGCQVWQRGEERLFVDDDRSGWAYALSAMSPEEWEEFARSVDVGDKFALLCSLIEAMNGLAGPEIPEDERLTQEDLDPDCNNAYDKGYPPLPEYLQTLQDETLITWGGWESPPVQALMEALQGLEWEDLGAAIALANLKLGRLSP